jgi:cell division protein ZapA
MPDTAKTLDITILGRTYKVACADGERDALLRTAAYLDAKMAEIRNAGKVSGTERIAVMAALNIAHELLTMKFGDGFDIGEAKRRIAAVEAKLDSVLGKQEKLF